MIERKFTTKLKEVQSDGGKEFLFFSKLSSIGLQYRITWPHTSELNGVVDSKN